ncbi:MAG: serine/threonine-protein kinase [Verrucomicrobiales bacterium]|nr:serine/threonine-protein kinase [Verrucomicrobiales bacterium]
MAEEEPIKIKDYQIHFPPLGEGAYGCVYRATYRGISDRALKIFRPGAVDLSTMARELEKISRVAEHQGIVTLHDFDLLNEPPYYAMGLHADPSSDGTWETRTLEKLCGHIDQREGWRLIRDIADALAYLHRNQIIHCDVKPSNILLTDETPFHIKICDFGQSRGLAAEAFEPVGTPLYASPEQLRDPRNSADGRGFRWDVYSFGVLSYKLLTGELPRLQAFASAESASFDPDSTLSEATLEATLAETGNAIDGEQLATMTEAVEEISWPGDFYVPSAHKELIEQCLKLNPEERPADMREVWSRMQQLDQQTVVKRARRLNTIFATLLVIAIWASGFAFIQAQKAKKATEEAMLASETSLQNAGAAIDLTNLIVDELNKGDISGNGAERLYSIVAENAKIFLENRFQNQGASTRILKFSAQTASLSGRQELEQGNLEEALKNYTSAYEIRSQLAEDADPSGDLAVRASRDLMEIGKIHELQSNYEEAETAYTKALEWRSQTSSGGGVFSLQQVRELAITYKALARVQSLKGEVGDALNTLDEIFSIVNARINESTALEASQFTMEAIRILEQKGGIEYNSKNLDGAARTQQDILVFANSLAEAPPSVAEEARDSYVEAVNALGRIQHDQAQPEAALTLFREEIKIREQITRLRPYDPEEKVALADAFAMAATCLEEELEIATSRSLAILYLEQSISLIGRLPSEVRNRSDVQAKVIEYNENLSSILEMEE